MPIPRPSAGCYSSHSTQLNTGGRILGSLSTFLKNGGRTQDPIFEFSDNGLLKYWLESEIQPKAVSIRNCDRSHSKRVTHWNTRM